MILYITILPKFKKKINFGIKVAVSIPKYYFIYIYKR